MQVNYQIGLIIDRLEEENPDVILYPDYEEALIGICRRKGMNPVAIYDQKKCIDILIQDGMTEEEAIEWFQYNTIDAWVGENTPCFLDTET
jgi:hypothetical protein